MTGVTAQTSASTTFLGKSQAWYSCVISQIRTAVGKSPALSGDVFAHVQWMLDRVDEFVISGELEKANRWIGFVQGVLFCHGSSIDELRGQVLACA